MTFERLTAEQVTSVHTLYNFLRKLRVIGAVTTNTEQIRITESGRPIRYNLRFIDYDASMKGKLTPEEKLSRLFSSRASGDSDNQRSE